MSGQEPVSRAPSLLYSWTGASATGGPNLNNTLNKFQTNALIYHRYRPSNDVSIVDCVLLQDIFLRYLRELFHWLLTLVKICIEVVFQRFHVYKHTERPNPTFFFVEISWSEYYDFAQQPHTILFDCHIYITSCFLCYLFSYLGLVRLFFFERVFCCGVLTLLEWIVLTSRELATCPNTLLWVNPTTGIKFYNGQITRNEILTVLVVLIFNELPQRWNMADGSLKQVEADSVSSYGAQHVIFVR